MRKISSSIFRDTLFPFIPVRIQQFQSALHLLQSYTMPATVLCRLGEIGVADITGYTLLFFIYLKLDMYKTWFRWTYPMLKGILYDRDEYQRSYLQITRRAIDRKRHIDRLRAFSESIAVSA